MRRWKKRRSYNREQVYSSRCDVESEKEREDLRIFRGRRAAPGSHESVAVYSNR
jgi:hypothetical protein